LPEDSGVDLGDPAAGHPADPERQIERDVPGGDGVDLHRALGSPIFMMAPLPNWRSIWVIASSIALSRSAMGSPSNSDARRGVAREL
jgi:hypothetical protein